MQIQAFFCSFWMLLEAWLWAHQQMELGQHAHSLDFLLIISMLSQSVLLRQTLISLYIGILFQFFLSLFYSFLVFYYIFYLCDCCL